jgi:hypothetical protein
MPLAQAVLEDPAAVQMVEWAGALRVAELSCLMPLREVAVLKTICLSTTETKDCVAAGAVGVQIRAAEAPARLVVAAAEVEQPPAALVDLVEVAEVQLPKRGVVVGLAAAVELRLVSAVPAETVAAAAAVVRMALAEKAQCFCSGLKGTKNEIRMD